MKKLGMICLIIVALASAGFGYGAWSQKFNFGSPVGTGSFDVVFDSFTAPTGSNQATFAASRVDDHNYIISLSNLYPSCDAIFTFVLKATGTVPAKITDIKLDGISRTTENKDLYPTDGSIDITVSVQGINVNETINAGGTITTGSLKVHTWGLVSLPPDAHDAAPSSSGSFTFEIDTEQGD